MRETKKRKYHFFRSIWGDLKQVIGLALAFNLIVEILISLLLMPLIKNLLYVSLEKAGLDYLSGSDLKIFASEPVAIAGFVVLIIVFMVLSLYRITAMYSLANDSSISTLRALFRQSAADFFYGLKSQTKTGIVFLVLFHPFTSFISLISLYFRLGIDRVMNPGGIYPAGALLLILFLNSLTMFVYPMVFLERIPVRKAIVHGSLLVRRHWFRNVFYLIVSLSAATVFVFGLYIAASMGITLLLTNNGTAEGIIAMFLSAVQIMETVITLVAVVIFSIINSFVAAHLFRLCRYEESDSDFLLKSRNKAGLKYAIISAIILVVIFSLNVVGPKYFRNTFVRYGSYFDMTNPEIIAHRGFSKEAPENTITAAEAAIEAGADRIEVDVQMSKDGVVYLMHDKSLFRTTGMDAEIKDLFSFQIDRIDAGGRFAPDYAGERIPRLEDLLEVCHGRIALKIELKSFDGNEMRLVQKVVRLVQESGMSESVMISSFSKRAVIRVRELDDTILTGLIATTIYGDYSKIDYADAIILNQAFLSLDRVKIIHQAGKLVYCWTSNSPRYISGMSRIGVDGIITDDPVLARFSVYSADMDGTVKDILYKIIVSITNLRYLTP